MINCFVYLYRILIAFLETFKKANIYLVNCNFDQYPRLYDKYLFSLGVMELLINLAKVTDKYIKLNILQLIYKLE